MFFGEFPFFVCLFCAGSSFARPRNQLKLFSGHLVLAEIPKLLQIVFVKLAPRPSKDDDADEIVFFTDSAKPLLRIFHELLIICSTHCGSGYSFLLFERYALYVIVVREGYRSLGFPRVVVLMQLLLFGFSTAAHGRVESGDDPSAARENESDDSRNLECRIMP